VIDSFILASSLYATPPLPKNKKKEKQKKKKDRKERARRVRARGRVTKRNFSIFWSLIYK